MTSWSYGVDYQFSGSDAEERQNSDVAPVVPPDTSNPTSVVDLYRLASLGSGGLHRRQDSDSTASRSPSQSPFASQQQFVPIQLNLSQNSFTASVGGGGLAADDGQTSAWTVTPIMPEPQGHLTSTESSNVSPPIPSMPVLPPSVSPSTAAASTTATGAVVAADGVPPAVQNTESASAVLPELLSQTARFPRPSPTATATPPSYHGGPPSASYTGERMQRPPSMAFPSVPSKGTELPTSERCAVPSAPASGSGDAGRVLIPAPPHVVVRAPPKPPQQTPSPPFSARPLKGPLDVPTPVTAVISSDGAQRRYHPTPLEILAAGQTEDETPLPTPEEVVAAPAATAMLDITTESQSSPPPPADTTVLYAEVQEEPSARPSPPQVGVVSPMSTAQSSAAASEHSAHGPADSLTAPEEEPQLRVAQGMPPPPPSPPFAQTSTASSLPSSASSQAPPPSAPFGSPPQSTNNLPFQPSAPQPREPVEKEGLAERFFRGLAPLIVQNDFRKTELKKIACTAHYTLTQEMENYEVSLDKIPVAQLPRLEPKPEISRAYETLGHLSTHKLKYSRSLKKSRCVVPVTCEDFCAPLLRYDRLLYAVCFSLWQSLLPYNDLADALMGRFFSDLTDSEDVLARVPATVVFRWLNDYGIDVLVMSRDRQSCSSYCTRQSCLSRNGLNDPSPKDDPLPVTANPIASSSPEPPSSSNLRSVPGNCDKSGEVKRVLAVLEFDPSASLWAPLTLSRSIHQTALARRAQRKAHAEQRRKAEKAVAKKATLAHRAEKVRAKEEAWGNMLEELQRLSAAEEEVTPTSHHSQKHKHKKRGKTEKDDEMHMVGPIAQRLPRNAEDILRPQFVATSDSQHPDPSAIVTFTIPFADMTYPNVNPTDFGVAPILTKAVSAWLPRTRLRLVLGVLFGLLSFVFGVSAVAYASHHIRTCVLDGTTDTCFREGSAATNSCVSLLLSGFKSAPFARRSLFGYPAGLGNCLIVCAACSFVGLLACVLVAFFSTRAVVVKSQYPRFAFVAFAAHVLLCAVVCAFAAYGVSLAIKETRLLQCEWLPLQSRALCTARYTQCPDSRYHVEWASATARKVSLALVACLLAFAALHLFSALLLPMPPAETQQKLAPAVPDTSGFQPSYFTPDGVLPDTEACIRSQIEPHLALSLKNRVIESESLVTSTITVAEMMRENREQSIRMTELARIRQRGGAAGMPSGPSGPPRRITYLAVRDPDAAHRCDDPDSILRDIVLSPQLSSRVQAVQSTMHARQTQPVTPIQSQSSVLMPSSRRTSRRTTAPLPGEEANSRSSSDPALNARRHGADVGSELSEDEVDTIWRDSSSSRRIPSVIAPSTADGLDWPQEQSGAAIVVSHEGSETKGATAVPSVLQTSKAVSAAPAQPSILAPPSLTRRRQSSSPGSPTAGSPTARTASVTATAAVSGRATFGAVLPSERRADHHARAMKDSISEIVRRVGEQRDSMPAPSLPRERSSMS